LTVILEVYVFVEDFSRILIKILLELKYRAKRAKFVRKYSILCIKIIGPWPLDPLVICLAKINSNCIHEGKEKFVWGGEKSIISVKQRLAKLLGRRPPPLPPRYLRPCDLMQILKRYPFNPSRISFVTYLLI